MKLRHVLTGLISLFVVGTAIPVLSGPSAAVAATEAKVDRALKKAKKALQKAKAAQAAADANTAKLSCPSGTTYVLGGCVESLLRSAQTFFSADSACNLEGKRLPSIAERQHAHYNNTLPVGVSEWTNSPGVSIVGGGLMGVSDLSTNPTAAFRCVVAP